VADSPDDGHANLSDLEKSEIRDQLERLLADSFFSHSKRFPMFLRFVTERTLAGEAESINERWLGVEIFGRRADYDTAADPVVRVTAAEIRKRIAQYYQDPAHANEFRIALPSGSYVPRFHRPKEPFNATPKELNQASPETLTVPEISPVPHPAHRLRHFALVIALTTIVAGFLSAGSILFWQRMHRPAQDTFWQPILSANDPVLLCIADQLQYSAIALRDAAEPTHQILLKDNLTAVVMDDVYATVKVAGILQSSAKKYTVRGEGATNLEDLRNGPTVFIGAFDNAWTLRLTNSLRYRFANNPDMSQHEIVDSRAPSRTRWMVDRSVQIATNNYRDYAIVARFTDANTGKLSVIVAGIGRGGTIAAGEFITDSDDLAQLKRAAQAAGNKTNLEIVLSTQIIDGQPGSPQVEAAYFW
jgi:hypothetical protein